MSDLDLRAIAIMLDEGRAAAILRNEEVLAAVLARMIGAAIAMHDETGGVVASRFGELRAELQF